MTPEGRVKAMVKKILAQFGSAVEPHWPVQRGMGSPTLDCNAIVNGFALSIECKAPGEKPTPRQWLTIDRKRAALGCVLVVDGSEQSYLQLATVLHDLIVDSWRSAWDISTYNLEHFRG